MKKVGTILFLVCMALLMTGLMSCQNQPGADVRAFFKNTNLYVIVY